MLTIILYALFILACVALVVSVLLQPGKADAGALFTSSVSTTAFGPRGTQTVLAKITIAAAATFMLAALFISAGIDRDRSVMADTNITPTPTPAASPAAGEGATAPAAPAEGAAPAASPAAEGGAGAVASPASSPAAAQPSPGR